MNNLQKFTTASEYSAATHSYPNVSWITSGDTMIYTKAQPTPPTPTNYDITIVYNVEDSSKEVKLYGGQQYTSYLQPTEMFIDGVSVTPANTYRFSTNGNHTVSYNVSNGTIGAHAFAQDPSGIANATIISAVIGSGITFIDSCAFYNTIYDSNISSITINATTPPTLGEYDNVFDEYGDGYPIYVPSQSVDAYKAASDWSKYDSRIQAIQS